MAYLSTLDAATTNESPNLDLLRSFAVSFVVIAHLAHQLGWLVSGYDFETLGRMGVAIFFVHTSFVLMLSMQRHGAELAPFYIRRAFRIYPLAMVMVLLSTLDTARWDPVSWSGVASNLLLIQNITGHPSTPSQLWSLPLEVQMYLVLPALFALSYRQDALRSLAAVWLSCVAVAVVANAFGVKFSLLQFAPCFLPGVLAFILSKRLTKRLAPWTLFAVVMFGAVAIPFAAGSGAREAPLFWALCLALGLTIPQAREFGQGIIASGAHSVAKYSYGIYFTHVISMGVAFAAFPALPVIVKWAIFFLALTALSVAGHRWVERHGIAYGTRLAARYSAKSKSQNLGRTASGDQASLLK